MREVIVVPPQGRPTAANDHAYRESNDCRPFGLTDFRRDPLITVESHSSIDAALDDMNRLGVHALLVTRQEVGSMEQKVVGLITYFDIERNQPHLFLRSATARARPTLLVSDAMTPWHELRLVRYGSLQILDPWEIYEMFKGTGLTHLLVVETDQDELVVARGLLSRAALVKHLNRPRAGQLSCVPSKFI